MAFAGLRRFDVQANYALGLALGSVVPLLGAISLAIKNYNPDVGQIIYGSKGSFVIAYFGCVLASALSAGVGFFFGLNSAGQRRNDKPARSWAGFFLGGSVLTADIILTLAFLILRFKQPM